MEKFTTIDQIPDKAPAWSRPNWRTAHWRATPNIIGYPLNHSYELHS